MAEIRYTDTQEIILVSLANTGVFKSFEVASKEDVQEAYNEFNSLLDKIGLGDTDIETQAGFCSDGLGDNNIYKLYDYYEISEDTGADLGSIIALDNYYNNLDDVRKILNDGLFSIYEGEGFNPELDAFIEMCEDWGIFSEVPEQLKGYIDYEKYYQDWGFNGGTTIELSYNKFMFI